MKTMKLMGLLVSILVAMAEVVRAGSISFSTDFSGTSLPAGLTAPYGSGVTVNNGLTITAAGDIWGVDINAPTVRYTIDPNDSRDFTIESVLTSRIVTGDWRESGIILPFGDSRTGLYGLFYSSDASHGNPPDLRYDDNDGSWLTSSIAGSYVEGTGLSFTERVTRHDRIYTFDYQETSNSTWKSLGSIEFPELTTGPAWIGLFGKQWHGEGSDISTYSSFSYTVVPEPSAIVTMGLIGLLACAWRKRK